MRKRQCEQRRKVGGNAQSTPLSLPLEHLRPMGDDPFENTNSGEKVRRFHRFVGSLLSLFALYSSGLMDINILVKARWVLRICHHGYGMLAWAIRRTVEPLW